MNLIFFFLHFSFWRATIGLSIKGQHQTNRQESLAREFSSEKGGKPQEYFVYFKVFLTHFWRKESVKIRRRICVVLPSAECTGQKHRNCPAPALWRIPHFWVPKGQTDHL
jgi:hypothetical protein